MCDGMCGKEKIVKNCGLCDRLALAESRENNVFRTQETNTGCQSMCECVYVRAPSRQRVCSCVLETQVYLCVCVCVCVWMCVWDESVCVGLFWVVFYDLLILLLF